MGSTHTLLTPTMIAREALRLLKNNLVMGNLVHRAYEVEFPGTPRKGGSVSIRKPVKFQVTKGRTRVTSTITEQSITLTVGTQAHVSWSFNMKDLTLTIEEYSERYIRPAAAVLANTVDSDLCALYDDVWNWTYESTGFVSPSTFMVLGKAMQKMDEEAAPPDDRVVVLNPAGHWSMANALSNWNFPQIGEEPAKKGFVRQLANCMLYMDQNIKSHTTGTFHDTGSTESDVIHAGLTGGTGIVTGGAGAGSGTSVTMINFRVVNTQVLKTGDVFTINGCFAVNPMSGASTGTLRDFVVTADASCGATETTSGNAVTVYIQPGMVNTGPYQTVDTVPAASAVVNIKWNPTEPYPQNLAFHKNAFALVMVPMEMPEGVWGSSVTEDGISIRIVKDYEIDSDVEVCRMDILYGVKTLYPELACRIFGAEG